MLDTSRYAILDGISSVDKGLMLSSVSPLIIPRRSKNREPRLRNLTALESVYWLYDPTAIPLTFTLQGDDKADLINKYQDLAGWLLNATELRLWYNTKKYYLGAVEGALDFEMVTSQYANIKVDFVCNPPCWHRVNTPHATWQPERVTPIPEQITTSVATCLVTLTGPGSLPSIEYTAAHPAALYFKINGSFTTLTLGGAGGLVINYTTPQSMSVYVDCDAQMVYHKLAGVMTAIPYAGDFPTLTSTGAIAVGGTGLNLTVQALAIERG